MAENRTAQKPTADPLTDREYLGKRYRTQIDWYWRSARTNKRYFKWTRYLVVVLGAAVTLISALASAQWIKASAFWGPAFAIVTPIIAAILAIAGGLSQSFRWDGSWMESVLTAQRLEKEWDRIRTTRSEDLNIQKELALLDDIVLDESRGFFNRLFNRSDHGEETAPTP